MCDKRCRCLYCGEESLEQNKFIGIHNCKHPNVVRLRKLKMASRPIKTTTYTIKYNEKFYVFEDYNSAMLFRRLVWIKEMPIKEALENKKLAWFAKPEC